MAARYDMRQDDEGWTVFDIWTGWPAVIKGAKQVGLEIQNADDLVDLLNYMNERRSPNRVGRKSGLFSQTMKRSTGVFVPWLGTCTLITDASVQGVPDCAVVFRHPTSGRSLGVNRAYARRFSEPTH